MNRHERRRQESLGIGGAEPSDAKAVNAAKARVRAAEKKLDTGDVAGAMATLKEAQALDPKNARAWFLTAMLDLNAGRITEAGDAILKASLLDEEDINIHANCAAIMNLCGRPMEAEASARFVLERMPDMPEAHCNLGVALEAQGKVADAREALSKAIDLRPGYPDALISLGNLWFRAGDYVSAAESFAAAVQSRPENVMAKTNLAVALRHLGELAAAEQQCLEAISLDQGYAEAHNALGNVRLQLGDVPGAVRAFEDAVRRREAYPEARANLAGAKFKAGDFEGAEAAYQDVLERHPEFAEAALGLGVVLLAEGRVEEAERRFRRAVEIRPALGEAWMNIADARGADIGDEDLKVLRERAADSRLAEEDRIAFLFALGAAEDAKGNYAAAMEAYTQGNERRRKQAEKAESAFDPDAFDEEIDSVISILSKEALASLEQFGDTEAEMIFICGMPRSGTTLVEQTLAAHPAVTGAGEVDILSGLLDDYPADVPDMDAARTRLLADTYLARLPVAPRDGRRVTDKTPQNVFFLGLIQALFPNAKIVHCRRDANDVALSNYFQNFKAGGLDWSTRLDDIRRYAAAEDRIMAHWRDTLSIGIHEVAYEDMVANPEGEARKLLEFCGLDWDDAVARPHEATGTVLTASNWQVRKPVYNTSVGRWQHYKDLPGAGG
ncbi:MAG: sulfotransferase [Rhodospirillales bacterium]|nr:sulfotransferase [Rhodospirillales bacterium]MBO6786914.1 sulfotransferase [Rhodospirillales bacterium]